MIADNSYKTQLGQLDSYHIKTYHSINDIPETFNSLFELSSKRSFFCSREWFTLLEENIYQDSVLIFTIASSKGRPLLILPCYESSDGRHLHSLANYYSSFYMPMVASEHSQPAALFDALFKTINACQYHLVSFQPMDNMSSEYSFLLSTLKNNAYYTEPFFTFGNWFEKIQSCVFTDYYQQRSSKLKNTIRRKEKKLSDYEIKITSDYDEIKQLLPEYQKIYSSSWKVEEDYPLFIENMVLTFAKMGQLRIGLAYIDKVPAAAQLWFVSKGFVDSEKKAGNIASIYKLAYDPQFKSTSIGSILTAAMFASVIEKDNVIEIDYLTGDDAYKKDWMGQRRERWGIVAYNKKTLRGMMLAIKRTIINALKKSRLYQWSRA